MGILPQELLDMIIDRLEDRESSTRISHYSAVSRQWVERTQKHHFKRIEFNYPGDLEQWRTNIEPNPSGVSRYTHELAWCRIDKLKGFDEHIRAFTNVETIVLNDCRILLLPTLAESFAPMGSSLVRLEIDETSTTPYVITSLLAALPRLRQLRAHRLEIKDDPDTTVLPSSIPFFEDANDLDLFFVAVPVSLHWVPPSARFRELRIDPLCILDEPERMEQWIVSSSECLEFLAIGGHPMPGECLSLCGSEFFLLSPLIVFLAGFSATIDLTGCTALETIQLDVPLSVPEGITDYILPSLSSPRLSKIILQLECSRIDCVSPQDLEVMEGHLCRLAKQYQAAHPGSKMKVEISAIRWYDRPEATAADWIESSDFMPKLRKEANVVTGKWRFR